MIAKHESLPVIVILVVLCSRWPGSISRYHTIVHRSVVPAAQAAQVLHFFNSSQTVGTNLVHTFSSQKATMWCSIWFKT